MPGDPPLTVREIKEAIEIQRAVPRSVLEAVSTYQAFQSDAGEIGEEHLQKALRKRVVRALVAVGKANEAQHRELKSLTVRTRAMERQMEETEQQLAAETAADDDDADEEDSTTRWRLTAPRRAASGARSGRRSVAGVAEVAYQRTTFGLTGVDGRLVNPRASVTPGLPRRLSVVSLETGFGGAPVRRSKTASRLVPLRPEDRSLLASHRRVSYMPILQGEGGDGTLVTASPAEFRQQRHTKSAPRRVQLSAPSPAVSGAHAVPPSPGGASHPLAAASRRESLVSALAAIYVDYNRTRRPSASVTSSPGVASPARQRHGPAAPDWSALSRSATRLPAAAAGGGGGGRVMHFTGRSGKHVVLVAGSPGGGEGGPSSSTSPAARRPSSFVDDARPRAASGAGGARLPGVLAAASKYTRISTPMSGAGGPTTAAGASPAVRPSRASSAREVLYSGRAGIIPPASGASTRSTIAAAAAAANLPPPLPLPPGPPANKSVSGRRRRSIVELFAEKYPGLSAAAPAEQQQSSNNARSRSAGRSSRRDEDGSPPASPRAAAAATPSGRRRVSRRSRVQSGDLDEEEAAEARPVSRARSRPHRAGSGSSAVVGGGGEQERDP